MLCKHKAILFIPEEMWALTLSFEFELWISVWIRESFSLRFESWFWLPALHPSFESGHWIQAPNLLPLRSTSPWNRSGWFSQLCFPTLASTMLRSLSAQSPSDIIRRDCSNYEFRIAQCQASKFIVYPRDFSYPSNNNFLSFRFMPCFVRKLFFYRLSGFVVQTHSLSDSFIFPLYHITIFSWFFCKLHF